MALAGATGMNKHDIDTPALLVDLDILERNLAKMNEHLRDSPAKVRPHAKSHKTPEIAHMQMAYGAVGITCAKVSEAEAMAEGGIQHILISSELIGPHKNLRAAHLAKKCDLMVACESTRNVEELAAAAAQVGTPVSAIIEADIGNRRCGVRSVEQAVNLARVICQQPLLRFRGIMGYEGQCVFIKEQAARREAAQKALTSLVEMAEAIRQAGMPVEVVSAGGTGTYSITGHFPGITDIQAGSYIFMDTRYAQVEGIDFEHSLTLLATVVSRPTSDLAVLDYGLKSVTAEFGLAAPAKATRRDGSHNPYGIDGTEVIGLSEEHARLRLVAPSRDLAVGDKVEILPTHCCTTINTHDYIYAVRNGVIEAVWKIAARGKFA